MRQTIRNLIITKGITISKSTPRSNNKNDIIKKGNKISVCAYNNKVVSVNLSAPQRAFDEVEQKLFCLLLVRVISKDITNIGFYLYSPKENMARNKYWLIPL